ESRLAVQSGAVPPHSRCSGHAVQADAVALGVLDERDEAVRWDRHTLAEHLPPGLGDAGDNGIKLPFDVEVNNRTTPAGSAAFHGGQRAADTGLLIEREYRHLPSIVHRHLGECFVE